MYADPKSRTCCCCSPRSVVLLTSLLSVLVTLATMLPAVLLLLDNEVWHQTKLWLQAWLEQNHWDIEVTQVVWRGLSWLDEFHHYVLAGVIACTSVHFLASLLLMLGVMLNKQVLFLPWLVSQMVVIAMMVVIFLGWTFLSFFVHLLVAILFPMVAGLVLGLWICLWREVHWLWLVLGEVVTVGRQQKGGYKPVPAHRQLTTISETETLSTS